MKDKMFEKIKNAKLGDGLTKETARARYENLSDEKQMRSIPHESLVDIKIKKAMAEGLFDNLSGKGQPLDLNHDYNIPEHLRPAYQILKNSGFVPVFFTGMVIHKVPWSFFNRFLVIQVVPLGN